MKILLSIVIIRILQVRLRETHRKFKVTTKVSCLLSTTLENTLISRQESLHHQTLISLLKMKVKMILLTLKTLKIRKKINQ